MHCAPLYFMFYFPSLYSSVTNLRLHSPKALQSCSPYAQAHHTHKTSLKRKHAHTKSHTHTHAHTKSIFFPSQNESLLRDQQGLYDFLADTLPGLPFTSATPDSWGPFSSSSSSITITPSSDLSLLWSRKLVAFVPNTSAEGIWTPSSSKVVVYLSTSITDSVGGGIEVVKQKKEPSCLRFHKCYLYPKKVSSD